MSRWLSSLGTGLLLAVAVGCKDPHTTENHVPAAPRCGDGNLDDGEACDGSRLRGDPTCVSLGFDTGTLSCTDACKLNTSACVKKCGNGTLDLGEACDGTLGVSTCSQWGYQACTAQCTLDTSHCGPQALAGAPAVAMAEGGPAILTDLSPKGLGDLVAPVPSFLRLQTFSYTNEQGFGEARKIGSDGHPVLPIAGNLDGDASGNIDLAAIQDDGTVERFLYEGQQDLFPHALLPAPASPCPAFAWVGAGALDDDGPTDLVALGCPTMTSPVRAGALLVYRGGVTPSAPEVLRHAGIVAATLADVDGDHRLDILYVSEADTTLQVLLSTPPTFTVGASLSLPFLPSNLAAADLDGDGDVDLVAANGDTVVVLENTGTSFAPHGSFSSLAPVGVTVADLDLDGKIDLAWVSGDKVQVRRNAGSFAFTPYEGTTGPGMPLSLSLGDVDGDGDLDVAATYTEDGTATATYILINKVR